MKIHKKDCRKAIKNSYYGNQLAIGESYVKVKQLFPLCQSKLNLSVVVNVLKGHRKKEHLRSHIYRSIVRVARGGQSFE